ncbi:hypothetical protein C8R45DRAFT_1174244 [Mycena sanguinolenta]|nr:hypothetical protein C8R45DRAFT_1174244 [Mycena sanguinolenta]
MSRTTIERASHRGDWDKTRWAPAQLLPPPPVLPLRQVTDSPFGAGYTWGYVDADDAVRCVSEVVGMRITNQERERRVWSGAARWECDATRKRVRYYADVASPRVSALVSLLCRFNSRFGSGGERQGGYRDNPGRGLVYAVTRRLEGVATISSALSTVQRVHVTKAVHRRGPGDLFPTQTVEDAAAARAIVQKQSDGSSSRHMRPEHISDNMQGISLDPPAWHRQRQIRQVSLMFRPGPGAAKPRLFGSASRARAEPTWGPEPAFGPAWYSSRPRPSRKAAAFREQLLITSSLNCCTSNLPRESAAGDKKNYIPQMMHEKAAKVASHPVSNSTTFSKNFTKSPGLGQSQAEAEPGLAGAAWPGIFKSLSPQSRAEAPAFRPSPGRNITKCDAHCRPRWIGNTVVHTVVLCMYTCIVGMYLWQLWCCAVLSRAVKCYPAAACFPDYSLSTAYDMNATLLTVECTLIGDDAVEKKRTSLQSRFQLRVIDPMFSTRIRYRTSPGVFLSASASARSRTVMEKWSATTVPASRARVFVATHIDLRTELPEKVPEDDAERGHDYYVMQMRDAAILFAETQRNISGLFFLPAPRRSPAAQHDWKKASQNHNAAWRISDVEAYSSGSGMYSQALLHSGFIETESRGVYGLCAWFKDQGNMGLVGPGSSQLIQTRVNIIGRSPTTITLRPVEAVKSRREVNMKVPTKAEQDPEHNLKIPNSMNSVLCFVLIFHVAPLKFWGLCKSAGCDNYVILSGMTRHTALPATVNTSIILTLSRVACQNGLRRLAELELAVTGLRGLACGLDLLALGYTTSPH